MLDETIFQDRRLCIVGSICRDVKSSPLPADARLLRDGETPTDSIFETIGGGAANSALFAAGLGAEARFAGKLGSDALGDMLEQSLRDRGIAPFIRHDSTVRTGSSMVLTYADGNRHFISHQPNNNTLNFGDIDLAMLTGGEHLLRGDIWFSQPMLDGGNEKLLQAAQTRGIATSLDLNWDPCWGTATEERVQSRKAAVRKLLPLVDLVHGNVRELNLFADSTELLNTLKRLSDWGAKAIVLHCGKEGSGYYDRGRLICEPSIVPERHVNAAGCGDLLSVCMMLMHRMTDIPITDQLRFANRIVAQYIEGKRNFLPQL
jgi:sugar/nucleoside kinase (ribokinase family)